MKDNQNLKFEKHPRLWGFDISKIFSVFHISTKRSLFVTKKNHSAIIIYKLDRSKYMISLYHAR